jgi:type 1 fimbriae regulatory protein FimB
MIETFDTYHSNKSRENNYNYQIKELPKYLTQPEVKKFFAKINSKRDRALFAIIYRYGLRVSEATIITPRDISWERNRIYIRRVKNGITAERRLFSDVKRLLKAYLNERKPTGTALFTGKKGNLKRIWIYTLFKQYAKEAKLDDALSVHSLRHSCGVHMMEAGADIREVQDFLGHRNIQNTLVYAHITDKLRQKTEELLEYSPDIVRL